MDDAFDIEFKSNETNTVDYTKLAATQRAIANFVNIVTGKQIPVKFQGNASYTDGQTVTIGTKLDGVNFDPAVGLALHEGSHIAFTDFDMLKSHTGRLKDTKLSAIAIMHDSANIDLLENDSVANARVFYDATENAKTEKGLPDGLKIDKQGNVFATGPGGVWIFDNTGKLLGKIKITEATSNCAFSPDEKTLYVTSDMFVVRVKLRD